MQHGYDQDFIGDGIQVPLPLLKNFKTFLKRSVLHKPDSLRNEIFSDQIHYSIVMNENTRQLIYSAYNIDQKQFRPKVKGSGKRGWKNDKDVGAQNQLNNTYYKDRKSIAGEKIPNPYDRGHMVMRFNNMWGATNTEADQAGKATFLYSNSSLQHENLNRDEWKAIEIKIVRKFQHSSNGRLAVFTGPIFGELDRHINITDQDTARIPSGFFKIICYKKKAASPGEELGVLAFAVFQDDAVLKDKKGNRTIKQNTSYQVTVSEIQNWTGIKFDKKLYTHNPLFYHDLEDRNEKHNVSFAPERIPVEGAGSIISDATAMRNRMVHLAERKVIINSAMINPVGNEKLGEWVSLHNRGNRKINIDNWRLVDGKGRKAVLKGSINSGESIRLKGTKKGKIQLSNSGGGMMLYDKEGCVIDHVTWSKKQVGRVVEGIAFMFDTGN